MGSNIPATLQAGDTWEWEFSDSDYPASTWTLTYALVDSNRKITITASADDDTHSVSVAMATTAAYVPGIYHFQAYVTDGTDRFKVDEGTVEVLPNFAAATAYDNRSHVKKVLDALEALIEGKASKDKASYSIGGRSISHMSPAELIEWRDNYRAQYVREIRKERIAQGKAAGSTVKVRFV